MSVSTRSPAQATATIRRTPAPSASRDDVAASGARDFEFDDREGPLRDLLLDGTMRWRAALKRTVIQAIDAGHLKPDTDADQVVYELDGLFVALMRDARFLRDTRAADRSWRAYQRQYRLLEQDDDWSQRLFARDFAKTYEEQVRLIATLNTDHQPS